jgi:hypothetical protein
VHACRRKSYGKNTLGVKCSCLISGRECYRATGLTRVFVSWTGYEVTAAEWGTAELRVEAPVEDAPMVVVPDADSTDLLPILWCTLVGRPECSVT